MKIALLTLSFPPQIGGVQAYLYETGRRIGEQHQVFVLTPVAGKIETTAVHKIILANGTAPAFLQSLHQIKPDIIIVGHAHPQLLLAAALYPHTAYACITYGNDFLAAQTHWHRPIFNRLLKRANPLITISQGTAYYLQEIGITNAITIPPGTDPARFTPREKPILKPVLLTISRLIPRKGIDTIIGLLPELRKSFPNIRYLIGGTGADQARLTKLAETLKVTKHVQFLGKIPDEQLPDIYRRSAVFVMLSREEQKRTSVEGFGIVYLEASASGVPIVAANSGGVADAVRHGETGLLVQPDDQEAAQNALHTLLSNPDLRTQLGQNGRQWVETEMNWMQTSRKLQEVLGL
ncbi:MAG TPA: glycosyltransferase family 1 protein [Anaerolineae bacterium]|nr:glycosyltransferase family 1 protein [Anaerolineae bacterium]